jgi:predicted HD phosphohydrolase
VGAGREFREPAGGGRQAADLAEQRGPREELRAAELLHEVAQEREAVRI